MVTEGEIGVGGSSNFLFNGFIELAMGAGFLEKTFHPPASGSEDFRSGGLIPKGSPNPPETGGVGGKVVVGGGGGGGGGAIAEVYNQRRTHIRKK